MYSKIKFNLNICLAKEVKYQNDQILKLETENTYFPQNLSYSCVWYK